MIKNTRFALLLVFSLWCLSASAQYTDPNDDGSGDSSSEEYVEETDSTEEGWGETEEESSEQTEETAVKPYIRFTMPLDTVSNLVSYKEIIDQEGSTSDSLYVRATKWIMQNFAKDPKAFKNICVVNEKDNKIVIKSSFDAYVVSNKYKRDRVGTIEFTMTIFVKEDKYKYIITNLVHVSPANELNRVPEYTYFEYYLNAESGYKATDKILRYADSEINKYIASLKKAMKEPVIIDEEDF